MHELWKEGQEGKAWTTKEELREPRDAATSAENAPTGHGPGTTMLLLLLVPLSGGGAKRGQHGKIWARRGFH